MDLVSFNYECVREILQILFIIFHLFKNHCYGTQTLKIECHKETKGILGILMFFFEVMFFVYQVEELYLGHGFLSCVVHKKRSVSQYSIK